ncbi:hypothetical protein TWF718_009307 [Orbilia javanica]|uniref:Uncharacterized protein n=1 Tax=Orbilia javanica TaxID=47235 RepID=A0AAN8RGX8_9PEZI
MLPEFGAPKGQKRIGKKRSHRYSTHNMELLHAQEFGGGEVVDTRPRIEREAEQMRDAVQMELLQGFENFSNKFFQEENYFSGRGHIEVFEGMNKVLHPRPSKSSQIDIEEWMDSRSAPYFPNAHETRSASAQVYTGAALQPGGYFETVERRVKTSEDINCDYATDFVWDIEDTIARTNAHRREVAQFGYEEEQIDLVPTMDALTISKPQRSQKRRSGSGSAKGAEYKQPRGIMKR